VISFGVYVYHHPCQRVIGALMARNGMSVTDHWAVFGAASFALTIIVAALSFAAIESPLLYLAKRRQQRQQAVALSTS
jgi:peptidoglycan/LPS O-acetylase OafA/YrhL